MLKLVCDKCKDEFIVWTIGAEIVKGDIWKHGYQCPYCNEEYITHYTNEKIRELQSQGKKAERELKKLNKKMKSKAG